MRCLSPHSNYSIQVIEGKEEIVNDPRGAAITIQREKPVIADFDKQGLLDWEIDSALELLAFAGLPEGIHPLTRVGVFDTESFVQRFPKAQRESMLQKID